MASLNRLYHLDMNYSTHVQQMLGILNIQDYSLLNLLSPSFSVHLEKILTGIQNGNDKQELSHEQHN